MTDRFRNVSVLRGGEMIEQRLRIGRNGEHGMMARAKKLLVAHVGKELKEEIIEATGVEESDGSARSWDRRLIRNVRPL